MKPFIALVLVGALVASSCGTNSGTSTPEVPAAITATTSASLQPTTELTAGEAKPAYETFFEDHTPIPLSIPRPTAEQVDQLNRADAPKGTRFFSASQSIGDSLSTGGQLLIVDLIRGPASSQEYNFILLDLDGNSVARISLAPPGICSTLGMGAIVVRAATTACVQETPPLIAWTEDGVTYLGIAEVEVSTQDLTEWVESLRVIEFGSR